MAKKKERPSRLPDKDEVDETLQEAQEEKKQVVEKYGRPPDPTKANRKKYTTYLDENLRDKLKIEAIKRGMTGADLLHEILRDYFKQTK